MNFLYSLVPELQTIITFHSFVQIQWNQRSRLRYDLLYPVIQLKQVFENFKIWNRTDLDSNFIWS